MKRTLLTRYLSTLAFLLALVAAAPLPLAAPAYARPAQTARRSTATATAAPQTAVATA
ncbi:MAG: hypothetical protein QOD28_518, partial [Acidobacteriota bacterium]|nr:hypothetical protein [Acidobacteriota bacterium]